MSVPTRLVLASASPQRQQLLKNAGIPFDSVIIPQINEESLTAKTPWQTAQLRARQKALCVLEKQAPLTLVLAADTVVVCARRILAKTTSPQQALQYLTLLSGRAHRVYTAVCLVQKNEKEKARVAMTRVTFKRLTQKEKENYLRKDEWKNKAGAYAIQGQGSLWVRKISGSYSNVVGLPLYETANLLKSTKWPIP